MRYDDGNVPDIKQDSGRESSSNSPSIAELEEDSSTISGGTCSNQSSPHPNYQLQFFRQVSRVLMRTNVFSSPMFSIELSESILSKERVDIEGLLDTLTGLGCMIAIKDGKSDEGDQQITYLVVIEANTIDDLVEQIGRVNQVINNLNHLVGNQVPFSKPI